MDSLTPASVYSNFTKVSVSTLINLQLHSSQKLYFWLKRQQDQLGNAFRCSPTELIRLLKADASSIAELIHHELYWGNLELTQLADFSFNVAVLNEGLEEPAVEFVINKQLVPSLVFGYLIVARNELHAPNIYLITVTRDQPEVHLDKLSSQADNPGHFELIHCYPVLEPTYVHKQRQTLLKEYKAELLHNFYRIDLDVAETICRRLTGQSTCGLRLSV